MGGGDPYTRTINAAVHVYFPCVSAGLVITAGHTCTYMYVGQNPVKTDKHSTKLNHQSPGKF